MILTGYFSHEGNLQKDNFPQFGTHGIKNQGGKMHGSPKSTRKADTLHYAETNSSPPHTPGKTRILPPTYLLLSIVFMVVLYFLYPGVWIIPPFWNLIGFLPIALGALLNILADRAFQAAKTTVKPFEPSSNLVIKGVFHITRNPMYLGFSLILTGMAILLRAITPFVFVVLFPILMDRVFIVVEEKMLAEKFGSAWIAYQQKTRRWI